jgi:hypothetical protein
MEENNLDIPQLYDEENGILISKFTEEEVFDTISQIEHNKAPGPNGFLAEFYQTFWAEHLMTLFAHLQTGVLPLFKLNFWVATRLQRKRM